MSNWSTHLLSDMSAARHLTSPISPLATGHRTESSPNGANGGLDSCLFRIAWTKSAENTFRLSGPGFRPKVCQPKLTLRFWLGSVAEQVALVIQGSSLHTPDVPTVLAPDGVLTATLSLNFRALRS